MAVPPLPSRHLHTAHTLSACGTTVGQKARSAPRGFNFVGHAMNITAKNILTVGDGRYKIAPNLYLVVRRNGLSRSFVFRYTFDGKRKDLSLGDPAIIKIQMAKDEALKCHTLLTQGVDPKAFREEKKVHLGSPWNAALTFKKKY